MYVRNRMTEDVVTIFKEASIDLAFQTMVERRCKQIPVVENGKFLGLVTEKLLEEVSPSKATSLSVYELNYLLSKTKVKDIMAADVLTCTSDILIEDAAVIMRDNDVNALPVVEEGKLVGIITREDILNAFLDISGVNDPGTRISLEVKDELGTIADIAGIIKDFGVNISHIINYTHVGQADFAELIIRLNTTDVDDIVEALKKVNHTILSIKKT